MLRDAKIAYFNTVIFRNEHILCFKVSVQNFVIVDVLKTEGELDEPIEDVSLRETLVALLSLLNSFLEISSLAVVHDYADVFILNVAVMVSYHICMVQTL